MSFLDDLFGYSNPDLDSAINRSRSLSKTGLSDQILEKMRRRLRLMRDRSNAGARVSTASRLTREGVPLQVREQILSDLSSSQLGALETGLADIDIGNENIKLDALKTYGDLSAQRPQGGFGLGQILGMFGPDLISSGYNAIKGLFGSKPLGGGGGLGGGFGGSFRKRFYQGLGR